MSCSSGVPAVPLRKPRLGHQARWARDRQTNLAFHAPTSASLWALATLLECQLGSAHRQDGCFPVQSSRGSPTPHPCRCCFLLLVPKDMTQFLAFEGKSFYFFPWALPREIGFSTKIPEHECCLLCARQSVLPLPQSLVFRCTVGMISPQALSQVGGIDSSCVSHGMWNWILGTVQRGQPLRTILPLE